MDILIVGGVVAAIAVIIWFMVKVSKANAYSEDEDKFGIATAEAERRNRGPVSRNEMKLGPNAQAAVNRKMRESRRRNRGHDFDDDELGGFDDVGEALVSAAMVADAVTDSVREEQYTHDPETEQYEAEPVIAPAAPIDRSYEQAPAYNPPAPEPVRDSSTWGGGSNSSPEPVRESSSWGGGSSSSYDSGSSDSGGGD